jgi:leucyl aminopeptidase
MDFKTMVPGAGGVAGVAADALLVLVTGDSVPAGLDAPLAALLTAALNDGDLTFKAGQQLYAHRVPGVKAARVAFVMAGDGSAKALRKAAAAGVTLLKGGGAKLLAVAMVGSAALTEAHAEALVSAVSEAVYVYRQTKPSAPVASRLETVGLVCTKALSGALGAALKRGEAVAAGVALARECANLPGNHCTPSFLAEQAHSLGKDFGLKVEVLGRKDCEKLGMGSFLAVAQGSAEPLKFIVARWQGGDKADAPVVLCWRPFVLCVFRESRGILQAQI